MMKKKMTVLTGLLLAVVMTAYSVSGTYAKYTSSFEGVSATARVAQWAFSVGDANGDIAEQEFTFDLFAALKEEDTETNETDVVAKNDNFVIAPGTGGNVDLKLINNSEVNATYTVKFNVEKSANIPVEFMVFIDDTPIMSTWQDDLSSFNDLLTEKEISNGGDWYKLSIQWRWPFNDSSVTGKDDETDTRFGLDGTDTIIVNANVVAEQVD